MLVERAAIYAKRDDGVGTGCDTCTGHEVESNDADRKGHNDVAAEESTEEEEEEEDVFFVDDSLTPIERFKKCSSSEQPFMRYTEVHRIAETVDAVRLKDTMDIVMPTLVTFLEDQAWQVRLEALKQIPPVAQMLVERGGEDAYQSVTGVVIQQLVRLFEDQVPDIRAEAVSTFIELARFVKKSHLGPKILTLVIQFAHNGLNEDKRIAAAELLHLLAPIVGPALALQFVVSEVVSLSEDHAFRVRKAVALHIESSFNAELPEAYHKKVLRAFTVLCRDDAWPVRKVCVEKLAQISRLTKPTVRMNSLVPVFMRLVDDPSDWVRKAALKNYGAFIMSLPDVDAGMLSKFVETLTPQDNDGSRYLSKKKFVAHGLSSSDILDIARTCAEHFGDMVASIGAERWPELRALFHYLVVHEDVGLRSVMAATLARVASLLGPESAEKELVDTLDEFLEDVPQVRKNVLSNFVELLAAFGPDCRESYLVVLAEVVQSARGASGKPWRFRMFLGRQLTQLSRLFTPMATYGVVVKILFALLEDDITEVRYSPIPGIPDVLTRVGAITEHPVWLESLIQRLCAFEAATTYAKRLLFVKIAVSIAGRPSHEKLFMKHFFQLLVRMCLDPVSNVRLAAVNALRQCPSYVWARPATRQVVRTRLRDPQRDVVIAAARCLQLQGYFTEADEKSTAHHFRTVSIPATLPDLCLWRELLGGRMNGDDEVDTWVSHNRS